MPLKIEPVKSEELALIVAVSRQTFYDTFYQQNSQENMQLFLDVNFTKERLKEEIMDPLNHFFFAKDDDEIIGYVKLSNEATEFDKKDALEIERIYVVKEKLGFGVGKALMKFAILFAQQMQKKMICLGVWEHNEKAISFYKSFGFEKFGEHIFMVGNDPQTDWLMKMML